MLSCSITEEFNMRRVLAQFTEWAWCNGKMATVHEMDAVALQFLDWLEARFPGQTGVRQLALEQIRNDMLKTYRALSYGGRSRGQVVPERRARLVAEAEIRGWSLA